MTAKRRYLRRRIPADQPGQQHWLCDRCGYRRVTVLPARQVIHRCPDGTARSMAVTQ